MVRDPFQDVKTRLGLAIACRYNSIMEAHVRSPIVAGMFYPGQAPVLSNMVRSMVAAEPRNTPAAHPCALIAPHAGYAYSGPVAAAAYRWAAAAGRPDRVVLLGANHSGSGGLAALPSDEKWRTPLGDVPIDQPLVEQLVASGLRRNPAAFEREHSIEVQLPFIQSLYDPPPPIVPVCIQTGPFEALNEVGRCIHQTVRGRPIWIVASSDFTHYQPDERARSTDHAALDVILTGDSSAFYRHAVSQRLSICGVGAITVLLTYCALEALDDARILDYRTSGDATGDRTAVVGYAAVAFARGG